MSELGEPGSSKGLRRVLIVHNAYLHRGGEDAVVEEEAALLRAHGHSVELYSRSNEEIAVRSSLSVARETLWSSRTTRDIAVRIAEFRPDVIHVHNTLPLISPSVYWAADRAGVPVVQTLHNFRLMCLNALFLREGHVCEDCLGRSILPGVRNACYRNSYSASAVLGLSLSVHGALGTYRHKVTRFIALNEFCRRKFLTAGLPPDRVVVKPNFVDIPAPASRVRTGLLFVGRLSQEKGIATLARAAAIAGVPLRVAGDGPEARVLEELPGVVPLGPLSADQVRQEMAGAAALIVPSLWYENFPRTIVEAFANALPVVASKIGALAEIVRDGGTGLLFEVGNSEDLAQRMRWAQAHPREMAEMGARARAQYESEFSAEVNYRRLIEIYDEACAVVRQEKKRPR